LERAAALEPDHAPIQAALVRAHVLLGRTAQARQAARRALDLSARLPREERLSIEALHHETEGRWERAAKLDQALWTFYPDKLEYGLRLADAQVRSGAADEALKTVAAMRQLPPPAPRDPHVSLIEANAH